MLHTIAQGSGMEVYAVRCHNARKAAERADDYTWDFRTYVVKVESKSVGRIAQCPVCGELVAVALEPRVVTLL